MKTEEEVDGQNQCQSAVSYSSQVERLNLRAKRAREELDKLNDDVIDLTQAQADVSLEDFQRLVSSLSGSLSAAQLELLSEIGKLVTSPFKLLSPNQDKKLQFLMNPKKEQPFLEALYQRAKALEETYLEQIPQGVPSFRTFLEDTVRSYRQFADFIVNQCRAILEEEEDYLLKRASWTKEWVRFKDEKSGWKIIPASLGYRLISYDQYLKLQRENTEGTHPVTFLPKENEPKRICVKHNNVPFLDVGTERSVYWFYNLFMGNGIVPSQVLFVEGLRVLWPKDIMKDKGKNPEVWKLLTQGFVKYGTMDPEEVFRRDPELERQTASEMGEDCFYLQSSRFIKGISLNKFMELVKNGQASWDDIEEQSLSDFLMGSYLIRPSDWKGDNLFLYRARENEKYKVIGIDNDLAFAQEIDRKAEGSRGIRNLLYLIDPLMDKKVSAASRKSILEHNPAYMLWRWLEILASENGDMMIFVRSDAFLTQVSRVLGFPYGFHVGQIRQIYRDFCMIQRLVAGASTHRDLFKALQPNAARLYQLLLDRHEGNPQLAMDEIYRGRTNQTYSQIAKLQGIPTPNFDEDRGAKVSIRESQQELLKVIDPYEYREDLAGFGTLLTQIIVPSLEKQVIDVMAIGVGWRDVPFLLNCWSKVEQSLPHSKDEIIGSLITLFTYLLNEKDVNCSQTDEEGNTLLHHWARAVVPLEKVTLANWIRKYGGLNQLNQAGRTALDEAMAAVLRSGGSSTTVTNLFEETPELVCQEEGFEQFYHYMKRAPKRWKQLLEHLEERRKANRQLDCILRRTQFLVPVGVLPRGVGEEVQFLSYNKGTFTKQRRFLPPFIKAQLAPEKFIHDNGERKVWRVHESEDSPHCFYFKSYPAFAGIAMAIGLLQEELFGEMALPLTFARIAGVPYLISPSVGMPRKNAAGKWEEEDNLQYVLTHTPERLKELDPGELLKVLVLAMLTNPEDAKPSSYALEKIGERRSRLVEIDAEQAFVPAVSKPQEQSGELIVQMKSVLFCMDILGHSIMRPEYRTVVEQIKRWDVFEIINRWTYFKLHAFDVAARTPDPRSARNQLFTRAEQNALFFDKESYVGVPFHSDEIVKILRKLIILQRYVTDNADGTWLDVFMKLEPLAAIRYHPVLLDLKPKSVFERFMEIDGKVYKDNAALLPQTSQSPARRGDDPFPTSTRSTHLLASQNIRVYQSRRNQLAKKKAQGSSSQANTETELLEGFRPSDAYVRLIELKNKFDAEDYRRIAAQEGEQNQRVAALLRGGKVESNTDIDFRLYPPYQHHRILEALKNHLSVNLSLRFCDVLTVEFLRTLDLSRLAVLCLRGCNGIGNEIFELVNDQNTPELRELDLSRNEKLVRVGRKVEAQTSKKGKEREQSSLYTFSNLQKLKVSECGNLDFVAIQVPALTDFKGNRCSSLRSLKLDGAQLTHLSLKECLQLYESSVDFLVTSNDALEKFRYSGKSSKLSQMSKASQVDPQCPLWLLKDFPDISRGLSVGSGRRISLREMELGDIDSNKSERLSSYRKNKQPRDVNAFFSFLERHRELKSLIIWNCSVSSPLTRRALSYIRSLTQLKTLTLHFFSFDEEAMGAAFNYSVFPNLRTLEIVDMYVDQAHLDQLASLRELGALSIRHPKLTQPHKVKAWDEYDDFVERQRLLDERRQLEQQLEEQKAVLEREKEKAHQEWEGTEKYYHFERYLLYSTNAYTLNIAKVRVRYLEKKIRSLRFSKEAFSDVVMPRFPRTIPLPAFSVGNIKTLTSLDLSDCFAVIEDKRASNSDLSAQRRKKEETDKKKRWEKYDRKLQEYIRDGREKERETRRKFEFDYRAEVERYERRLETYQARLNSDQKFLMKPYFDLYPLRPEPLKSRSEPEMYLPTAYQRKHPRRLEDAMSVKPRNHSSFIINPIAIATLASVGTLTHLRVLNLSNILKPWEHDYTRTTKPGWWVQSTHSSFHPDFVSVVLEWAIDGFNSSTVESALRQGKFVVVREYAQLIQQAQELFEHLSTLSELEELTLESNLLYLTDFVMKLPKLQKLILRRNKVGEFYREGNTNVLEDAEFSNMSFHQLRELKKLDLRENQITDEALTHLHLPGSLRTLKISGNPISRKGINSLELLKKNNPNLTVEQ